MMPLSHVVRTFLSHRRLGTATLLGWALLSDCISVILRTAARHEPANEIGSNDKSNAVVQIAVTLAGH
jgi:hypothetical protein